MCLLLIYSLSYDQLTHKKQSLLSSPPNTPSQVSFYPLISLTLETKRAEDIQNRGSQGDPASMVYAWRSSVPYSEGPPLLAFIYSSSGQLEWNVILPSGLWNSSDFMVTYVEMTVAISLWEGNYPLVYSSWTGCNLKLYHPPVLGICCTRGLLLLQEKWHPSSHLSPPYFPPIHLWDVI